MQRYTATEFRNTELRLEPTGKTETYVADTKQEAARFCLYTRRLSNGWAFLGGNGLVVHSGAMSYAITTER